MNGTKLDKLEFCEHCVYGKASRLKFNKAVHTTKGILNYVHFDLWGPARHLSLGNARYFMYVVDDFSRKVRIFILKSKDEAFEKFMDWKKLVEVQTGRKVKMLRTNNGLEIVKESSKLTAENKVLKGTTLSEILHSKIA